MQKHYVETEHLILRFTICTAVGSVQNSLQEQIEKKQIPPPHTALSGIKKDI